MGEQDVMKNLLPVLFPFVLAYGIAYMLAKPVRRIAGESRWAPSGAYTGGNASGPAVCRVYRDAWRSVPACIHKEAE